MPSFYGNQHNDISVLLEILKPMQLRKKNFEIKTRSMACIEVNILSLLFACLFFWL